MYKWPNRCSQLRYRASAIPSTGTLAPVQDYSVDDNWCYFIASSWDSPVRSTVLCLSHIVFYVMIFECCFVLIALLVEQAFYEYVGSTAACLA
jgi:hypothetical protein